MTDFGAIIRLFSEYNVRYIIVGGMAKFINILTRTWVQLALVSGEFANNSN